MPQVPTVAQPWSPQVNEVVNAEFVSQTLGEWRPSFWSSNACDEDEHSQVQAFAEHRRKGNCDVSFRRRLPSVTMVNALHRCAVCHGQARPASWHPSAVVRSIFPSWLARRETVGHRPSVKDSARSRTLTASCSRRHRRSWRN